MQHVNTKVVRKVKNVLPKIFIDNRKVTEYAGFITHLHLLLHRVTLDNEALVVLWHQFTYSLLVPDGRLSASVPNVHKVAVLQMFGDNFVLNCTRLFQTLFVHFANCEMSILSNDAVHLLLQCVCDDRGSPWSLSVMNICLPIPKHCAPFSDTGRVHNMFAIDCNKSSVNFTGSNVFRLQKTESRLAPHSLQDLISVHSLSQPVTLTTWKLSPHQLHQVTIYTPLNTPNDWSGTMKQLRVLYEQTFFTFRTPLVQCT